MFRFLQTMLFKFKPLEESVDFMRAHGHLLMKGFMHKKSL